MVNVSIDNNKDNTQEGRIVFYPKNSRRDRKRYMRNIKKQRRAYFRNITEYKKWDEPDVLDQLHEWYFN
jgi:hypothetical protein